ncbi:TRAP transporter solute receptor, TAXI family [Streptomyces venezuelae]|uniref:TAXI family TRAP transporter solute-binding subunit n=1 Tax=Streptomyces gardneri TaxID=66892 RepID=UPI0006BD09CE|nr:TAXI family TRAP transporter solute-binding subunit [Streptomyces gardneri]ALO11441.1 TRAP transporter solute receptor, TAXI family [Streptomyces venezuelae]QPK48351.1 TAXI family TRAP transporter solute-binding subunit [Streptomyces gardneri]WRK39817.1 TAXI family TRAP transporter solute-binding subunit [Streptomyces venezuelae]CUM38026.1 TRAP transporter solute receptor, TAXI family precursor [Streptomyces venezuelae]
MFASLSRAARRRLLALSAALLAVCGVLVWWLVPFGPPVPSGSVTFSTGVPTGVYQKYGGLLKQALAQDLPEVSIELTDSEGSQQNLARVATGEADFTVATADAVAQYQRERKPGFERLRGCARLYDDYVQLVVRKDSKVRTVRDLRGLRVGVGQDGSGVRLIADRVLAAAGLTPVRDVEAVSAGIDTMPGHLESGDLDAFFWSGGLPTAAVQDLSERYPIRLIPLDATLVDRLHDVGGSTRHYRSAVIPPDAYDKAQDGQRVETLAVANLLVTTAEADPDLVEGFTRTVIRSRDVIGGQVHPAQLVDLRTAVYTEPLPLHEGARRYYRSVKP